MNTANNLTRFRVSLVWLSTVAIAFMLVVLNIAPVAAQSTEMVMLSNLGEAEAERYLLQFQRHDIGELVPWAWDTLYDIFGDN